MRRLTAVLCALCLVLSGCAVPAEPKMQRYTANFLDLFDTVSTIVGYAYSKQEFETLAQNLHDDLAVYHRLFDIYNDYEGICNLKTVNDQAGIAPVQVDGRIITLLQDCRDYYALTGGKVNVAMGSVLKLWHDARNTSINDPSQAYVPDAEALREAGEHTDWAALLIDEEASTVFLMDPRMRLDVGAVAKGWAVQRVCEQAPEGLLVSIGGNICATGPKPQGEPWVVGIQDPEGGSEYLQKLSINRESVVTSGDYQRYFTVDGKRYHHIIDPATRQPAALWRSVSIVCQDSGLADALSTALFLLPQAEGQAILDVCGAMAMWVDMEGNILYSPGLEALIRN